MKLTIGSLFSGIGGIDLGLEECGLGPVVWQCDSDPQARALLARYWPGTRCYNSVEEIDARATRPDIICGGFPCQPVSLAGNRRGAGDSRWLWPQFARVVEALRPPLVLIENVPGLRSLGLREVLADLAALGLDAEWDLFSAAEVGAPHRRKRLFILAAHPDRARELQSRWSVGKLGRRPVNGTGTVGGADADGVGQHGRTDQQTATRAPGRHAAQGDHPWSTEPDVARMVHGVSARVDRTRLLGNSCVPAQAALAFRELARRAAAVAYVGATAKNHTGGADPLDPVR